MTMNRNQTMRTKTLIAVVAIFTASCSPPVAEVGSDQAAAGDDVSISGPNSDFLVKLTSGLSAQTSKPGDVVTGVLIDPGIFRGGRVEGTVELVRLSDLRFSFHTVHFQGKTYAIESTVTSVVSSTGNAGQDDLGQRIRVAGGTVIAYGTTTAIDEGAEIRLVGWDKD